MRMLWGMAPWLVTIAVVMLLVEFGKVRGFDAYEKVKLLGMGWGARIRNWFIHLNGRVVTAIEYLPPDAAEQRCAISACPPSSGLMYQLSVGGPAGPAKVGPHNPAQPHGGSSVTAD